MWTHVSTVTAISAYARSTMATLNDLNSSSQSQLTHTLPAPPLHVETVLNVCAPPNYVFIKCEEEELRWCYQLSIDTETRKFTAL